MSNFVEIECVEIEGVGKCKLPIADIPYKKYRSYQEKMKNEELFFDGMIELIGWAVKEDGSKAFTDEYIDNLSMNDVVALMDKLQEGMPKALDEVKKK